MPFKSEAQRRLFHAKAARGEISEKTVSEWERATKKKKKLPMHVKKADAVLDRFGIKAAAATPVPATPSALAARIATSLVMGGTGAAMNVLNSSEGDKARQGMIGFTSNALGGALGPAGMVVSPIIDTKLQQMTAKEADHADDRMAERIKAKFPPETLPNLREQARDLDVAPGRYYLPLKDQAGKTRAVAAFKTVGPKDRLVLATVLTPKEKPPPGVSLSHLMKQPLGERVGKVDASPKQYTLRKNADGRMTCTCKDFKYRRAADGTDCKHIQTHVTATKQATVEGDAEPTEDSHLGRNLAVGAAAALPWLGTIGQAPMRKVPHYTDPQELLNLAQPGDLWLDADLPRKSFLEELRRAKTPVSLGTGTPEGYHAGVIDSPRGEHVIHFNDANGIGRHPGGKELMSGRFTLFRPQLTDTERTEYLGRMRNLVSAAEKYQRARGAKARRTLLGSKETALAAINELLVPKLDSPSAVTAAQGAQQAAMADFTANSPANPYAATCSGGIAAALPLGKHVVPGKPPERVVPSDFLRSKTLVPLGHYSNKPLTTYEKFLKHGPTASRLLIGGTLAGGVYGLSRLFDRTKDPAPASQKTAAPAIPDEQDAPAEDPVWKQHAVRYGIPLLSGLGTYALSRKQRFSSDPTIAALQRKSKGRLTILDDTPHAPTLLDKLKVHLFRGADDVKLVQEKKLKNEIARVQEAIRSGAPLPRPKKVQRIRGAMLNQGEPAHTLRYTANADPTGNVRSIMRVGDDKLYEGKLWNKYAPGAMPETYGSVQDVAAPVLRGAPDAQATALQAHLREKFPAGFIVKPRNDSQLGDNLLTHVDDFGALLRDSRGKSDYLRRMLAKPDEFIVQEALPLAKERKMPGYSRIRGTDIPVEYRVHVINGRVVPALSSKRWLGMNPITSDSEMAAMNRAAQAHVSQMPPEQLKDTMLGMDVAKLQDGRYKIIETNPGGKSGYLMPDYSKIPSLSGHKLYQTITGRASPVISGLRGLGAAGGAALLSNTILPSQKTDDAEEDAPRVTG